MTQYRGGRKPGSKNLEKIGERYRNKYNVYFSLEEKKRLESLVNSANRKRRRLLEQEKNMQFLIAGKDTGLKIKDLAMGRESDFILAKKTKSLQRFKSKKQYEKYIQNLERVVDREYVQKRAEQYRSNHIKGLKEMLGPTQSKDIIKKIKEMSIKEYMQLSQQDDVFDISYVYLPVAKKAKAARIRKALNI